MGHGEWLAFPHGGMKWLFNCFGHYFCLHFEAFQMGTGPVYMAFLGFMGEEFEAKKFAYCVEVAGDGRKLYTECE
ncbi:hypothetical protein MRB53_002092 [Persea americana]|uniref:Uncharacterized protein n=1 Tax=Persea americana TaxID=3435 RepID=A0ACC2MTS1_PERAE|nr:hypothetical protein MRB53_002092 [Persea americana]